MSTPHKVPEVCVCESEGRSFFVNAGFDLRSHSYPFGFAVASEAIWRVNGLPGGVYTDFVWRFPRPHNTVIHFIAMPKKYCDCKFLCCY